MPVPTPDDEAYAREVELAATALAQLQGDLCFHPLHDTEAGMLARQEWRHRARVVLDAAEHRALWDEARKVNALLREHGYEYPLGFRGVRDALGRAEMRLEDPDCLREALSRIEGEGKS